MRNYYDGNGNLTSKTDAKSQTIYYTFDNNNRLTGKSDQAEIWGHKLIMISNNNRLTGKQADQQTAYTYDASGNILTLIDTNTDELHEYDDLNRLTRVTNNKFSPAKIIQYAYYEDGTRKTMTEPEGVLVEYEYDKAKRLLSIKRNGVVEGAYQYNSLGLRTKLTYGNGACAEYLSWDTFTAGKRLFSLTSMA